MYAAYQETEAALKTAFGSRNFRAAYRDAALEAEAAAPDRWPPWLPPSKEELAMCEAARVKLDRELDMRLDALEELATKRARSKLAAKVVELEAQLTPWTSVRRSYKPNFRLQYGAMSS